MGTLVPLRESLDHMQGTNRARQGRRVAGEPYLVIQREPNCGISAWNGKHNLELHCPISCNRSSSVRSRSRHHVCSKPPTYPRSRRRHTRTRHWRDHRVSSNPECCSVVLDGHSLFSRFRIHFKQVPVLKIIMTNRIFYFIRFSGTLQPHIYTQVN